MKKRLWFSFAAISAFLVAGILLGSPRIAPFTPVSGPLPVDAAAAGPSTVWAMDGDLDYDPGSRAVAIDTITGQALLQVTPPALPQVRSRDGRWAYEAHAALTDGQWNVLLTVFDLQRGAITKMISIIRVNAPASTSERQPTVQLALSPDNLRLVVAVTVLTGSQCFTRLYVADPTANDMGTEVGVSMAGLSITDAVNPPPLLWLGWSWDSRKLVVTEYVPQGGSDSGPLMQVNVFVLGDDLAAGIGYAGAVQFPTGLAQSTSLPIQLLSPDGRTLYLMQIMHARGQAIGYRWVAFDTEGLKLVNKRTVAANGAFCDISPRFTPDGRYLYDFCAPVGSQTEGTFLFLDLKTGAIANQVSTPLANAARTDSIPFEVDSPDGKTVYVINSASATIAAFNVERQALVGQTKLAGAGLTEWMDGLAGLMVGRASAKGGEGTVPAISPDGTRLYLPNAGASRPELWAIDTDNLQVIDRWLPGKYIIGLLPSLDGRELYALGESDHTLYILDAHTGSVLRAFAQVLKQPSGFLRIAAR